MILQGIVYLTVTVGLLLYLIGMYFKGKGLYLSLVGALMIMILGIMLFTQEIGFKSGAIVNSSSPTQDVISYTYSAQSSTLNNILAWSFMLLGLFGIIFVAIRYNDDRWSNYDKEDY